MEESEKRKSGWDTSKYPIIDPTWEPKDVVEKWDMSEGIVYPFEDPILKKQYEETAEEFARLESPEEISERLEPAELRYIGRQLELPERSGQIRAVKIWSATSPYLEAPITIREMTPHELARYYGERMVGFALPKEEEAIIAKGVIGARPMVPLHELGHFREAGLPYAERMEVTSDVEGLAKDVSMFYEEFAAWYWALRRVKNKSIANDIKERIRDLRKDSIIYLGRGLTAKIENLAKRKKRPEPFKEDVPEEQMIFPGFET